MTFTSTPSSYSINLPPLVPIQPEKEHQVCIHIKLSTDITNSIY
jgi:hypothetical protein